MTPIENNLPVINEAELYFESRKVLHHVLFGDQIQRASFCEEIERRWQRVLAVARARENTVLDGGNQAAFLFWCLPEEILSAYRVITEQCGSAKQP
jgi:hypothetical protein